jgi:hypothetical protein
MNEFDRLFGISGLSLDRLRTFIRVVEAGCLTRAVMVALLGHYSRAFIEVPD